MEEDEEERKSSLGHSPNDNHLNTSANSNANIYSDDPTSKARGLLKGRLDPDEVSDNENEDEVFDPKIDKKPLDVNVFNEDSPSKEKDNKKLADLYRKVNKANVEVVLNNVGASGGSNVFYEKQEDDDLEEEDDPKLTVDLQAKKLNFSE